MLAKKIAVLTGAIAAAAFVIVSPGTAHAIDFTCDRAMWDKAHTYRQVTCKSAEASLYQQVLYCSKPTNRSVTVYGTKQVMNSGRWSKAVCPAGYNWTSQWVNASNS